MNGQRIVGIVLLIIGIALLFTGLHASHSLADKAHNLIFGRYTQATAIYIFGGGAIGLVGLLMTVIPGRAR